MSRSGAVGWSRSRMAFDRSLGGVDIRRNLNSQIQSRPPPRAIARKGAAKLAKACGDRAFSMADISARVRIRSRSEAPAAVSFLSTEAISRLAEKRGRDCQYFTAAGDIRRKTRLISATAP